MTGGTGFVGAHVVQKLVERGDRVTVLVRPTSNTSLLEDLPVETVVGDITNFESLLSPLGEAEEVYHVAADYRLWARDPREIYRNNVDGTRNVLEAARRCRVRKVVYTSTVGCLGLSRGVESADESTPVSRDELVGNYKKSKFDAERLALEYAANGLDVVVVNPSTPVGPGDIKPTPTGKMILDFVNGKMAGYVDTGLNLVAVEDVAAGHLLAAEKGQTGQRYILGNRNMSFRQILESLARISDRKAPSLRIPHSLALAAAVVDTAKSRALGTEPGITIEGVVMSRKKMYYCSGKAVNELELPQSSVEDALTRAVRWFEENGYVKRP